MLTRASSGASRVMIPAIPRGIPDAAIGGHKAATVQGDATKQMYLQIDNHRLHKGRRIAAKKHRKSHTGRLPRPGWR